MAGQVKGELWQCEECAFAFDAMHKNALGGYTCPNCFETDIRRVRPLSEWHEDEGPVLWWSFPIEEAPYAGSPLDTDWPGYHTHWTPIPIPVPPLTADDSQFGVGA